MPKKKRKDKNPWFLAALSKEHPEIADSDIVSHLDDHGRLLGYQTMDGDVYPTLKAAERAVLQAKRRKERAWVRGFDQDTDYQNLNYASGRNDLDDDTKYPTPTKKVWKEETKMKDEAFMGEIEELKLMVATLETKLKDSDREIKRYKKAVHDILAREEKGLTALWTKIHALEAQVKELQAKVGPDAVLHKRQMPDLQVKRPYRGGQ